MRTAFPIRIAAGLLLAYVLGMLVYAPGLAPGILMVALISLFVGWVIRAATGVVCMLTLIPRLLIASIAILVVGRGLFLFVEVMSHDTSLDRYAGRAIFSALGLTWLAGMYGTGAFAWQALRKRRLRTNSQPLGAANGG